MLFPNKIKHFLMIAGFSTILLTQQKNLKNPLLIAPEKITIEELSEKIKNEAFDFTFSFKEEYIRFIHRKDKNGIEIKIKKNEISQNNNFQIIQFGEIKLFEDAKFKTNKSSPYLLTEPLNLKKYNPKPTLLSILDLAEFIKNKKIIFYTGAGISAMAKIPTMNQLMTLLHINDENNCLKVVLKQPLSILEAFTKFCIDMKTKSPTNAHITLTNLASFKKSQIFTENLDLLHERTGIIPQRINTTKIKNEISESNFKEVDAIICIGLSHDDRGFLAWYKKQNPQGVLVAIDFVQPEYLGNKDFLTQGDLQEILPTLQSILLY